ncbi:MAG: flagellar hook-basal body complex protein [Lachnospiraceae bacterium]|nr:flagellar hook-basal body complex protein [Lachnospiraceae bacterium]
MNVPAIGNVTFDFSDTTAVSSLNNNVSISATLPEWVVMDNYKVGEDKKTYLGDENRIAITNEDGTVTDYTATRLDFGNGFNKDDLIGNGFYTTCCTCYAHYSFKFNEGKGNSLDTSGAHLIYNIDISEANSASDVVAAIVNGVNEIEGTEGDRATPSGHFTTLIQDPNNANAIIVYDNRPDMTSGNGFGYIGRGVAGKKTSNPGASTINAYADGGKRIGYEIDEAGRVYVRYDGDGGRPALVGQIAAANFDNVMGLAKAGQNLYDTTLNSGEVHIQQISDLGERMYSGVLEASNVDLSEEFSNMIIAQRGFQANSRVIGTSDQMLETAKNMKN